MHREPARDQLRMAARDRHDALGGDVEGDQGNVIRCIPIAFDRGRHAAAGENVIDRHHAVGQVLAEATQEADREGFHRDVHREIAMHRVANALAAD